ncbi:uncharacterized protein BXZ73DRAFT_43725 [Epithele typhae]|uniref:uncharacterized protein n=1 Tax=Epithele typhae TaxID=378194 RepID=UPI002007F8FD|nr:uncharacterized protein BXZ73DRAFT_43725 [Epithele typhae]KAH9939280.1 hypothetical protein BXZ73DRAFT_43725 [Epithele typhae]
MPDAQSQRPTPADAPFNQANADTILRSADLVDFRVHRLILSQASPFFADMFSLPQPLGVEQRVPVIDVSEDSKTLRYLLSACYPTDRPEVETLEEIVPVLVAGMKYSMDWLAKTLSKSLVALIPQDPLQVWAHACRSELPVVARLAISDIRRRGTAEKPAIRVLDDMIREAGVVSLFQGINSGTYFRLRQSIRRSSENSFVIRPPPHYFPESSRPIPPTKKLPFVLANPRPDIALKCYDSDVIIEAHGLMVALQFPRVLHLEILRLRRRHTACTPSIPTHHVDMPFTTLCNLLGACYKGVSAIPTDVDAVAQMLRQCQRYQVAAPIESLVRQRWDEVSTASPLEAYFAAVRHGIRAGDVQAAAEKTLDITLLKSYTTLMEEVHASAYHFLLLFHSAACARVCAQYRRASHIWEVRVGAPASTRAPSTGTHNKGRRSSNLPTTPSILTMLQSAEEAVRDGTRAPRASVSDFVLENLLKKVSTAASPGIQLDALREVWRFLQPGMSQELASVSALVSGLASDASP